MVKKVGPRLRDLSPPAKENQDAGSRHLVPTFFIIPVDVLTFVVFERFEHGVFGGVGTDGVPQPVAGDHDEVLRDKLGIQTFDKNI